MIEPTISSFQALHERLGLIRATDAPFFLEWQTPTVPLDKREQAFFDHIQQRYYNYYNASLLTEGTVLLSIVALLADIALPQCLAYMIAAPQQPSFGMVTNGSDFIFCKLENAVYDFSEAFSLLSRRHKLYEVASILTQLKKLAGGN